MRHPEIIFKIYAICGDDVFNTNDILLDLKDTGYTRTPTSKALGRHLRGCPLFEFKGHIRYVKSHRTYQISTWKRINIDELNGKYDKETINEWKRKIAKTPKAGSSSKNNTRR